MPLERTTISEMAATYDVSLRTLRFYEERGLLAPAKIGPLTRGYGPADHIRLQVILKAKRLGFSLAEIRKMIGVAADTDANAPSPNVIQKLDAKSLKAKIDELIERRMMVQSAIDDLTDAYKNSSGE